MYDYLFAFMLLKFCLTDWLQIDSSYTSQSIGSNGWYSYQYRYYSHYYSSFPSTQCSGTNLQFFHLNQYYDYSYKVFYYRGYQYQLIFDIYFDNADSINYTNMSVEFYEWNKNTNTRIYYKSYIASDLNQQSNRICRGGSNYAFNFETIVSNITITTYQFRYYFSLYPYNSGFSVGIRNILIYTKACFPRCATCIGEAENQCQSCQVGTLTLGKCQCYPQYQFAQQGVGCIQECQRDYFITNADFICVPDRRINNYITLQANNFSSDSRCLPVFINDPLHTNLKNIQNYDPNVGYYLGGFQFYEGVQFKFQSIDTVKFIRLRISFFLINFQTQSMINLYQDNILQSVVSLTSQNNYNAIQITQGYYSYYTLLKIETIFRTYSLQPLLQIKGQLLSQSQYWGIKEFDIDIGKCKENCLTCLNFDICQQCASSYKLYQNNCISSCPIHSQNCIDYSDEYPYSRYLAKGFYNINMTLDEVASFYDSVTNEATNFQSGQKFGFFPDKIVLGGLMVWFDASYIKKFTITQPHYAVSIRFNFTFGDQYPGQFYYYIESTQYGPFLVPSSGVYNWVGKTQKEIAQFFYNKISHTQNTLSIKFQCVAPTSFDIRDGFCAISEYFIVVHYCPPFCSQCTSANDVDCTVWAAGHSSSSCLAANTFLTFDSSIGTYNCITCSQPGCLTCSSLEECTSCSSTFQLINGLCVCPPFNYISTVDQQCVQCYKLCEYCKGGSYNNCLTCVPTLNRYLKASQCKCQPGYQEDGINLPCIPICGDKLIVQGEDCDDGNFNPFDGCDQCQFSCSQYCDLCVFGVCESCQLGYQLIQNTCFPICHTNLPIPYQECKILDEATNGECAIYINCSKYCTDCRFGICYQCNEQSGWYLQEDSNCSPICGDLIVTAPFEECDDGNAVSDDGCHLCLFSCGYNCDMCHYGYCSKCQEGYKLSPKINQCIPICGDFIVGLNEVCDDNTSLYDGCYNCKVSCQPVCTNCSVTGCLECNTQGWYLDAINRTCKTICGDGLIINEKEECDDAISDNCNHCQYECQDSCFQCVQGLCLQCIDGWVLDFNFECNPISGDALVLGSEQCDDKNFRSDGGCFFSNYTCQMSCDLCSYGKCMTCKEGFYNSNGICIEINNDGLIVGYEYCDDGNNIPQDGCYDGYFDCPQFCLICVQGFCIICDESTGYGNLDTSTNFCLMTPYDQAGFQDEKCNSFHPMILDIQYCTQKCNQECKVCQAGWCLECNYGYYLNKKTNQCYTVCGDEIVVGDEKCDDANQDLTDACANCKLTCDEHCVKCVNGECLKCQGVGWTLNPATRRCQTICGDNLTAGNEQCDDGNYSPEDGCYNCHFECQKSCTLCDKGTCFQCEDGWKHGKKEAECETICGDNTIIPIYEDCEDGNSIPYDGCFDCKFQCQDECGLCKKGVCQRCDTKGWELINHFCLPKCGDSYVVEGYEECDDGNEVQYDGCYQCSYQCEEQCTVCQLGICYDCNSMAGYIIDNHKCIPNCGDGRVVGTEQCDDGNKIDDDGCFNCQFKCDLFCVNCQSGVCLECESGRQVNEKSNKCLTFCGDGITVLDEENCDDGNDDNGDGCSSKCQVEKNWACKSTEGTISKCGYTESPEILLNIINSNPATQQIVKMTFSQKMKRSLYASPNSSSYLTSNISNMNIKDYHITIQPGVQILADNAIDVYFLLTIDLYAAVTSPLLQVRIANNSLISEYNLTLLQNISSITLVTPTILSSSQKNYALSAQKFNQGVIFSLVGLSSLCVATGSSDPFWNLMDQLQYLSYIKYINIEFPNNLNIYFEVFKLVTISPLTTLLRIDVFFAMLDGEEEYFIATKNKFEQDEINAYFFNNFQSFLFFLMSSIVLYWMAKYIHLILYKIRPKYLCRFNFTLSNMFFKLRKMTKKQYQFFFYNGILRLVMSNWYDVSFACAIQIAYYQPDNMVLQINYFMALTIFVFQFFVTLIIAGVITQFLRNSTLGRQYQYKTLFEEIQHGHNFWLMQYNTVSLLKKQLFIALMVFMQNQGELQALSIALLQTIFLAYLIFTKPMKKKFEYYKSFATETIIIFNSLTFLAYAYQKELTLTTSQQFNLGWLHIFTSTAILGVSLGFDFIDQFNIIIDRICKSKKPVEYDGPGRPDQKHFDKLQMFF